MRRRVKSEFIEAHQNERTNSEEMQKIMMINNVNKKDDKTLNKRQKGGYDEYFRIAAADAVMVNDDLK